MNTAERVVSSTLRRNVLAASLALALPLGMVAQAGTLPDAPGSNADTRAALRPPTVLPIGYHNGYRRHALRTSPSSAPRGQSLPVTGVTLVVTNCADDGSPGTLRQVISAASDGDTIDLSGLACSEITLQSGEIAFTTTDLTIKGPGQEQLTIDGNDNGRIFDAIPTAFPWNQNLTISNLTLANGRAPVLYGSSVGGCVYVGGGLSLVDTTITGCSATGGTHVYGGAIDAFLDVTLDASTVTNSTGSGSLSVLGGGIYAGGTLHLHNGSVIAGNSAVVSGSDPQEFNLAAGGGAIAIHGLEIVDSVVSGNETRAAETQAYGGGISLLASDDQPAPTGHIVGSIISNNSAWSGSSWSYGGGVAAGLAGQTNYVPPRSASLQIEASTIAGNEVRSNCSACFLMGGGISAFGSLLVDHSTISGNRVVAALDSSASAYGGGLATHLVGADGQITITQSTVADNAAEGRAGARGGHGNGGGVAALYSPVQIDNSTIARNHADDNGGGVVIGDGQVTASIVRSSIIADNRAEHSANLAAFGQAGNGPAPMLGGDHNLIPFGGVRLAVPPDTLEAEPRLLPLADNGGATWTMALRPSSPAINAGSNPHGDSFDQRGPGFARVVGGAADIGAWEWQDSPCAPQPTDSIFVNGFDEACR